MPQGIDPKVRFVFLALLVLVLAASPEAFAGTTPAGEWEGKMKTPDGEEVDINLSLSKEGSVWSGTLESDAIGPTEISGLQVTDTRISFTFQPAGAPFPAHFTGSYIAGDDRVTGTFSLRGNSRFVKFKRVPGSEVVPLAPGQAPPEPKRIRHDYHFALEGRGGWWAALHVVKDENYNINTLTKGDWAFDASLNWFAMDEFNLFVRGYRGGQKFTDNPEKLARYEEIGLNGGSYLKLDGVELGVKGYLGSVMMRHSRFNPYLTATGGIVQWELTEGGRGSEVIVLDREAFTGNAAAFSFGLGTEYELSRSLALQFEWAWRFFLTGDDTKWTDPDNTWSNTHAWALSFGLLWGFW